MRSQDDPGVRREHRKGWLTEMTFYESLKQQMFAGCLPYVRFSCLQAGSQSSPFKAGGGTDAIIQKPLVK